MTQEFESLRVLRNKLLSDEVLDDDVEVPDETEDWRDREVKDDKSEGDSKDSDKGPDKVSESEKDSGKGSESGKDSDKESGTGKSIVKMGPTELAVREALVGGESQFSLVSRGFNKNTVRTIASNLRKEFGKDFGKEANTEIPGTIRVFTKGAPPEALINAVNIPNGVPGLVDFELGMKFGLGVLVMGVRMAQELSAIGVSQAAPLIKMAGDMRAGEMAAAKNASQEAASMAAGSVMEQMFPYLSNISETEKTTGDNADVMKKMMVRLVEPMMKNLTKKLAPGVDTSGQLPDGWTRK